ncbi:nuclear transport factor 2 family protein [Luteimonas sp. BDR2-5]|uniref:nuclear transport factor 2 family protein n=1 Tax=Proluteimonas luteida TaxID=2878685 RepID=UPI001E5D8E8C|nr:nuclear transport factor 2 family protein [Luteimonas sp. BDR2-5]MCD9028729.1 nuclear transport factor 2 family protein [Luteimonas sp. BDR2-5]
MNEPALKVPPGQAFRIAFECEQLIRRFALRNDAGDHDALAEMFVEDGSFARPTAPDAPVRGREAIRALFRDRPRRFTRHLMLNTVIDALSPGRARATSYVALYSADAGVDTAAQAPPYPASGPHLLGGFDDELVQVEGRWLFLSRRGSLALRIG